MKIRIKTILVALSCVAPLVLFAADPTADNTDKNVRDRSGEMLTPVEQSNDRRDLTITAETRKKLMQDKSLSLNAQNCKIITTKGGAVTLRGPVDSEAEKAAIAEYAKEAGASSITNQLEVKAAITNL